MASFLLSLSLVVLLLSLLSLFSIISISEATSSFSFSSSDKNASFASQDIALYGDAKLVDSGSSIQLNDSVSQVGGRVVYNKPFEFVDTETAYFAGFSTAFSFSMPSSRGEKIGFFMFRANGTFDLPVLEVKFDITNFRDSNVTVTVNGTMVAKKSNNLTIMSWGKKKLLYAWIDYHARGYYLDVCLSKVEYLECAGSHYISRVWLLKDEDELMVGLKLYSGNFNLHSWRVGVSYFSKHMLTNEEIRAEKREGAKQLDELLRSLRRRENKMTWPMWKIVTCVLMTSTLTGLVFFAITCIRTAFKRNDIAMVMPEECGFKAKQFECAKIEKLEVVMSKAEAKQERK